MKSALAWLALATVGCGTSFVAVRPSEPLTAASVGLRASVDGIWLTEDVKQEGMGEDRALAVQLALTNPATEAVLVSPSAFACLMELSSQRPGDTLSLLTAGGGEGPFPGEIPEEGSLLASVSIPAGQTRTLWAVFRGYRFPGSDVPRRVLLQIPAGSGLPLELTLADPGQGNLRWQVEPDRSAIAIGFRNTALFGGLTAQSASTEVARLSRAGPLLWEVGIESSLFVQSKGPLVSQTSSFLGTGLIARLTLPVFRWGTDLAPRQLGLFAGANASLLLEIIGSRAADDMTPPKSYGAFTGEIGLELDVGALRFAGTPFPLSPAGRAPLPRWLFRVGYAHASIGGVQADGHMSSLRLAW